MLLLLACAVVSPLQCSHPSENRIFDTLRSSAPFSIPNALAVSADGKYIYAGEGGSIAILDTDLPGGYSTQALRIPVSKFGAKPAKILVDPGPSSGTDDGFP